MSNRSPRLMARKDERAIKRAHRAYLATPVASLEALSAGRAVADLERAAVRRYASKRAERALLAALRAPLAPVRSSDVLESSARASRAIAGAR